MTVCLNTCTGTKRTHKTNWQEATKTIESPGDTSEKCTDPALAALIKLVFKAVIKAQFLKRAFVNTNSCMLQTIQALKYGWAIGPLIQLLTFIQRQLSKLAQGVDGQVSARIMFGSRAQHNSFQCKVIKTN